MTESDHKFWSKDHRMNAEIEVMMNPKGKTCRNCVFSSFNTGDVFITCGIWTDFDDGIYRDYKASKRDAVKKKMQK